MLIHFATERLAPTVLSALAMVCAACVAPAAWANDAPALTAAEGIEFFEQHGLPERVVLSNRHHLRHAERFADAFGCELLCNRAGLHEFENGGPSALTRYGRL